MLHFWSGQSLYISSILHILQPFFRPVAQSLVPFRNSDQVCDVCIYVGFAIRHGMWIVFRSCGVKVRNRGHSLTNAGTYNIPSFLINFTDRRLCIRPSSSAEQITLSSYIDHYHTYDICRRNGSVTVVALYNDILNRLNTGIADSVPARSISFLCPCWYECVR